MVYTTSRTEPGRAAACSGKRCGRKLSRGSATSDVRAFHQVLLEDGMLPFAALEAKTDRSIARGGR